MASIPCSSPLYERVPSKNIIGRAMDLAIFFLLIALLAQRLLSLNDHGLPWFVAFLCESWFTFIWILTLNAKWSPVEYKTYPERLMHRASELPPLDMFVTTADPVLEPPIVTVNTVLSLLAVDYPAHKLACYVSDDGASALTFYSVVVASKFAKLWIPFCKKYGVQVRAPFRHFSEENNFCSGDHLMEYQEERRRMKDEYEKLVEKIEDATQKPLSYLNTDEFNDFTNIKHGDHPSIVKVIWESKVGLPYELPTLVYISREKRPNHPHRYKAGAMNALIRVSGVLTNAPFMLNVDCDMYANNPQVVLHAMCLLLGMDESQSGYVQCPLFFYDGPGEFMEVLQQYLYRGLGGMQGPFYQGTGTFHRRNVIYGALPEDKEMIKRNPHSLYEKLAPGNLRKSFGDSEELIESVASILSGSKSWSVRQDSLLSYLEAATKLAGCSYERCTIWGKEIGCLYGSTVEDILTGLRIHSRGWKSVYCTPIPHAFLGRAPSDGPTAMIQQKRWATGLFELLFHRNNPLVATLCERHQFRQCLGYLWVILWAPRSIPDLFYALLPAYCIITNSYFLPKGLALCIPTALLVFHNMCTLSEYLRSGVSARSWWEAYRNGRITSVNAWLFGFFGVVIKLLGLSEPIFEVTHKGQTSSTGGSTFNELPIFIPATVVSMVHLMALLTAVLEFRLPNHGRTNIGIGEICGSMWVILCFWPYVQGLFRKGRHGLPTTTIFQSAALALLFLFFSKRNTMARDIETLSSGPLHGKV